MQSKPFIHPDILINIRESLSEATSDRVELSSYSNAKSSGEEFASEMLESLFSNHEQYGKVRSHFNTERLSSERLSNIREQIIAMHYQRKTFSSELTTFIKQETHQANKLNALKGSLFSFLYKKRIERYTNELAAIRDKVDALNALNSESYVNLRFDFGGHDLKGAYSDLASAFATLKSSNKIWDVVETQMNLDTKAAAGTSISRNEVKVDFNGLDAIQTVEKVMHVENYNGGDFYLYPNFIVYFKNNDEIALIDYSDLYILFTHQRFLEEKKDLPNDAVVVGETWYRVNRDGSPDKRFAHNYKIPIANYGSLHFKTASGVNELYYISDASKADHFVKQFNNYQSRLRQFNATYNK